MENNPDIRLSRRDRKKKEMEEKILQAALSLFQVKGLDGTTVDEITEKADIGRGTFFNYFPTKDDLFLRISERVVAELGWFLEKQWRRLNNTYEAIKGFFLLLAEKIQAYPDLFERTGLRMVRVTLPARSTWADLLALLLKEGQKRGEVRPDIDAREMAEIITAVGLHTILSWLQEDPRPPLLSLLNGRMNLLWEGMRASEHQPI